MAPRAVDLERRIFARFDAAQLEAFVAMLRRIDAAVAVLSEKPSD